MYICRKDYTCHLFFLLQCARKQKSVSAMPCSKTLCTTLEHWSMLVTLSLSHTLRINAWHLWHTAEGYSSLWILYLFIYFYSHVLYSFKSQEDDGFWIIAILEKLFSYEMHRFHVPAFTSTCNRDKGHSFPLRDFTFRDPNEGAVEW